MKKEVCSRAICREISEKYEIIRILGQGQSGIVYLAKHKSLRVYRAIKTVPRESMFYEGIKQEATLLKELRHPGIPVIYDLIESDSHLYLIEEYATGESLYEYIKAHGRFSVTRLVKLGLELAKPIAYLHSKKIVHLDLSPNNIMIDNDQVKILDFDHSMYFYERSKGYGSLGFASKEQIDKEMANQSMDIYAIGAVLYYAAVCEVYDGRSCKFPEHLGKIRDIILACIGEGKDEFLNLSELIQALQKLHIVKSTKNIAVVAAKAGLGATYLSMCMAKEVKQRNQSVHLLERNRSGCMHEISKMTKKNAVDGFMHEGISIYPFRTSYIEMDRPMADVEIFDYGDDAERAVFENPDALILICDAKIWNTKYNLSAMHQVLCRQNFRNAFYVLFNQCLDSDRVYLPDFLKDVPVFRVGQISDEKRERPMKALVEMILKAEKKDVAFQ